jgi:prolycopene isomerase
MQGRSEGIAVHIPTILDSSLAPPGEHIVVMQAFVPEAVDLSPTARNRFAESMLDHAEKVLPALRKHITFVARSSTEEQEKYPLHRLGPISLLNRPLDPTGFWYLDCGAIWN